MLTEDRKNIWILKNLEINRKLSKYDKMNIDTYSNNMILYPTEETFVLGSHQFDLKSNNWRNVWDGITIPVNRFYNTKRAKNWALFKINVNSYFNHIFRSKQINFLEFFQELKHNIVSLESVNEKIEYLDSILEKLNKSGQTKVIEGIVWKKKILSYENIILNSDFKRYITEENLVKFILKTKKGLRLDYINCFDRIIPDSVIENKDKAEELKVFDNYVILHCDTNVKNIQLVEKKDPILFGLIQGSDKFYFIDDWIDEKCDLTYDKIVKEMNLDEKLL